MARLIHRQSRTTEYRAWRNMINRCYDIKNKRFNDYGGRGIIVCNEWKNDFLKFFNDMGVKPTISHSLERRNNSDGYNKENCFWATITQQARNKRNNRVLYFNNTRVVLQEFSDMIGKNKSTIAYHLLTKSPNEVVEYYKNKNIII